MPIDSIPNADLLRSNPMVDRRIVDESERLSLAIGRREGGRGLNRYNLAPPLGRSGQFLGATPGVAGPGSQAEGLGN